MVTPKQSGYAIGYAANPRSYVSYAVTRWFVTLTHARTHMRTHAPVCEKCKPWRNRVTHVTTPLLGVTARVTSSFSRNSKKRVEMDRNEDKAAWVRQNLPTCTQVAQEFKNEFESVSMVFASENGHVLGKRFEGDGIKLSDTLVGRMVKTKKETR